MSLNVRTAPEADAQIGAVDDWWRRNRLAAPDLFLEELAASFDVIGCTPQIGRPYRQSPVPGTRRVLLTGSRYHVYYVPFTTEVRVLAVWGMRSVASVHLCGWDRQRRQGLELSVAGTSCGSRNHGSVDDGASPCGRSDSSEFR